jgi:hypothetical protein
MESKLNTALVAVQGFIYAFLLLISAFFILSQSGERPERFLPLRDDGIRVRGSGGLYADGLRDLETRFMAPELLSIFESIGTWPGIVKSFQRDLPSILAHPLGLCLGVFYNDRRQL